MGRQHAVCVSRDGELRRVVGDALATAGMSVDCCDVLPADLAQAALVVVDRATRQEAGEALRGVGVPVVVVGDSLDDDGLIALMLDAPVSHLVQDPCDRDLGITTEKLASGDLFGLEKYLAAGTPVREREILDGAAKREARGEVCAWAEAVGARRPVVHRVGSVVDELLMNAMLDAPRSFAPPARPSPSAAGNPILRWACDGRVLAISVGDGYGGIRQRDVMARVRRARNERGRPQPSGADDPGAGLGLYLVLANVASLIVNVEPGRRSEVVCLFDVSRRERRAVESGVRSLHVFAG